ncbi:alpha/beta fold hydrolase [Mycoplasmoides pirum]|uniref:alpha/beta fold hydrolase n=1 Tax=Mycoplasmoides pirum TaxID=2122 RepID=UPI0004886F85|nr:alpha/beta hydrolase [Mycoplasmoides pirum]
MELKSSKSQTNISANDENDLLINLSNIKPYYQWGWKSKPIVIFIHGFSSNYESHARIFKKFRFSGYKYYSFNLPGHGDNLSHDETEMKVSKYASLVSEFIFQNKLENIALIGHSMGGAIAVMVNSLIPNLISHLILEDPLNRKAFVINSNRIKQTIVGPKLDENNKNISLFKWIKNIKSRKKEYKNLFKDILSLNTTKNIDIAYQKIENKPTLLMFGKNDLIIPPKKSIDYIAENAKNLKVCIFENSGHSPHLDEPELYYFQIINFLKNNKLNKKSSKS